MKLWIDGAIRSELQARIAPQDRGFLLGDGLFETIRISGGRPAHVARHLKRLRAGAEMLGIPVPADEVSLRDAIGCVIMANELDAGSLRLTLTRGPGPRGVLPPDIVAPTLMIASAPGLAAATDAAVIVASVTRRNEQSPLSRIKSLNYLDNILARREAAAHGADEAILLNTQGMVAEGSCANLLVRVDDRLVTPPLADGALGGVARACLLEGGVVQEASLVPDDLRRAEAMFLCNSLGVRSITRLDGQVVRSQPDCRLRLQRLIERDDQD